MGTSTNNGKDSSLLVALIGRANKVLLGREVERIVLPGRVKTKALRKFMLVIMKTQ